MSWLLAEVLDKEPSAISLVAPLVLVAFGAFYATRWQWWLAPGMVVIGVVLAWWSTSELLDRFVGPAIWKESQAYYIAVSSAALAVVVAPMVGACLNLLHARRRGLA